MKIAKTYTVAEFLLWTRRKIYGADTWNGSDEEGMMDRDELEYRRRSQGW